MKKLLLFSILLVALVLRLVLSFNSKHGDMYNNWDWGEGAWKNSLSVFYDLPKEAWNHSRPNQPPGSIYMHAFSYWVNSSVSFVIWHPGQTVKILPNRLIWWWENAGPLISLKIPAIVADFVIFWTLIQFGKLWKRPKTALIVGLVYLFNPALVYNSGYWGQTDAVVASLSLLALLYLVEGKLYLSPIFLGLSLITKASWAPIVPLYILFWLKNYRSQWLKMALAPLSFFILAIPFHPFLDLPIWLSNLYLTRIVTGESAWITVIAFNFWNLFYPPSFTPVDIPILGIPAIYIAWSIVAIFYLLIIQRSMKNFSSQKYIYLLMILFFVIFLFAPKMLQRYLYPVFPLLSLVLIFTREKIYWFIYGMISFCYLINMYYLWWSPGILFLQKFYTTTFMHIISIIYLASFTYLYVKKIN